MPVLPVRLHHHSLEHNVQDIALRVHAQQDPLVRYLFTTVAEAAGDHLGKGRRIAVEGSLRQDVYEKDGEERKAVSVVAKRLEYL